jgi:iron(III) transport system ATP-binding protein
MFLALSELSKVFPGRNGSGDVAAVDNINIAIEQGQLVTLLGPSGCGKTTTLRMIAGFEFPTSGRIVLDGEVINNQPPNVRDMAMVFQSYAIFPHLTVYENVIYGLKIKRLSRDEIRRQAGRVMEITELTGLEKRAPNQLSGGQQQRVALARALVMEPKVLLFDEPLSNLDAKLRIQMRTEIRRIQQELGITSIYVTHDQEEAMVLSDQIVIMNRGRTEQVGSAVAIYRRPVNRFVADFIGRANFVPVTVVMTVAGAGELAVCLNEQTLPIPAAAPGLSVTAGQSATLLVRPESIRVHPTPPTPPFFAGTVERLAYLGAQAEYDVRIGDHIVTAIRHDPRAEDLHGVGTIVYLSFAQENLYLLPGG